MVQSEGSTPIIRRAETTTASFVFLLQDIPKKGAICSYLQLCLIFWHANL